MKVLYITTMYPIPPYPQQGIFCHEQVKALLQLDVEVHVIVPIPFYNRDVSVREWNYEGVKITYIRYYKLPGTYNFHKIGRYLYYQLKRKVKLCDYDVFHADAPLPSGYAAMLASKEYRKPFVVHGHGLDVFLSESYKENVHCDRIVKTCECVYRNANAVIGVSQKVLDEIQKKVNIDNKGFVVYNGVDVERFVPIPRPERDEIILTTIGNLIPIKGHDITLAALSELKRKGYSNVRLKIAGRGPLENELKELAVELGVADCVDFLGYLPYEDVVTLLQNSDLFVLPSWYEALGCVYLEAMACGVPAIGCHGNGIDEVIRDGVNGYLVEGKNKKHLSEILIELLNRKTRNEMGQYARKTVVEKYQWSHSATALKSVYEEIRR